MIVSAVLADNSTYGGNTALIVSAYAVTCVGRKPVLATPDDNSDDNSDDNDDDNGDDNSDDNGDNNFQNIQNNKQRMSINRHIFYK